MSAADPDLAVIGAAGLPSGYMGRTDSKGQQIANAKYVATADRRWEVTTGPAHILYAPQDSASGNYTVSTEIRQLAPSAHAEAYGLFIGGSGLDGESPRYTYFIVRGTGEFALKVRDGAVARDLKAFSANAAVPKADAQGVATYRLAARSSADSVRFMVNDRQVTAVARNSVPTDGIVGLRVNHNLRVSLTPVSIKR